MKAPMLYSGVTCSGPALLFSKCISCLSGPLKVFFFFLFWRGGKEWSGGLFLGENAIIVMNVNTCKMHQYRILPHMQKSHSTSPSEAL